MRFALAGVATLCAAISNGAVATSQTPPSSPASPPVAIPTPSPTPTPTYRFVYRPSPTPNTTPFPDPNTPQIDEIDLSDSSLTPPANIRARILTSASVVSVTAETLGSTLAFPRQAPGIFVLEASVPDVPRFLRNRDYDVTFTATGPGGRTASITLPLTIR